MDKSVAILNTIIFLSSLFVEELAKEQERTGKTDAELLDDAKLQIQANEILAIANLAKYNAPA